MENEKALRKLLRLLEEFRKLDPEMPLQQAVTFVEVALRPGISVTELSDRVGQALSSTSRNVAALGEVNRNRQQGHNLVVAKEDPLERRKKIVSLTPKGRRVAETLITLLEE